MSTPLSTSSTPITMPAANASARPAWLQEPLLHFALLGALLFAADHFLFARTDDPRSIVVGSAVTSEAKNAFRTTRGREPNAQELAALTSRWVDNEVLYREGIALQVDQGDTMIRDRVIFKALMLVESGLKLPPVDDAKLREWFETQRVRYDEPARYDFQEAVLVGDTSEAAARAFAQALNAGMPSDAKAGLRVFKGRPLENLVQSYGSDFARALEEKPQGEWRAVPTRDGLRVMRLGMLVPAKPATFEALRNVVLADWTDATMAQLRTDAVRARGKKYSVKVEGAAS